MLQKKYRLNLRKKRVSPQSNVVSHKTPFFILHVSQNNRSESRFGFIITKRVDKRAVIRNKIKRKVRSCIETLLPSIKSGYDILFILKKESLDIPFEELKNNIHFLLKREELIQ